MEQTAKFSLWLQGQLSRRNWKQADLAFEAGISRSAVSAYVNGHRVPDPDTCDLIADALSVDLDLVLWQAGHRPNLDVIDPDDPATTIISLAKRVDWSKGERFEWVEGFMRQWINLDHGETFKRKKDKE